MAGVRQYGTPPTPQGQNPEQRKDQSPRPQTEEDSPRAEVVEAFHRYAAVDTRAEDVHHTLGQNPSQASPGSHAHDGKDSPLLLDGFTINGSKSSPAAVLLPDIIACLVRLGATDSSTA